MNECRRAAAALAAAALCGIGCASAPLPRVAFDDWQTVEARGMRIIAQIRPEELDGLARELAGFDAAFSFLLGKRLAPPDPTTIFLIRDRELARRFHLGGGIEGYALSTFEGSFNCIEQQQAAVETRHVLFHEYTHLLLQSNRSAFVPRWYNEGVAEYFSTLVFRDGALVVGGVPVGRLAWVLQRRHPMPLAVLFGGDSEATMRGEAVGDFYATAWALTHYLMSSPKGRSELSRFERELARGAPLDEAREKVFGRSFDRLTEELAKHVAFLGRGVAAETVLDPRKIEIRRPSLARPLRRGEVADALGSLALVSTREGEEDEQESAELARSLLEIAVEEDPASARARAALARARALAKDPEGAEALLSGALRDAPGDAKVQLDSGHAALAGNRTDDAEARFRRAISLDPRSPAAWFGLGRALARSDQPEPAREALEHARTLGWSSELDLELGRLHAAAHRVPESRALLQPIAADPHGGRTAEEAAKLLRELGGSEAEKK
jgi:tetratricopeptide (TPR) repeat protein